ncbi:ATP-binding protein [Aeromonas veronii]|uniref:ATP-binding protein n=1 Tax=Aeromonas veronii TaxID=654 RepID=UPI001F1620E8|nr:ATP-binding protein [Aeromonas veronii]MCF5844682.1 AAA family ATPase [Aeromonas veronii]
MFLNKVIIKNLWGNSSIELNLENRVTILTGINGSGKSSILNIIYDSLSPNGIGFSSTSKNRMWTSHLECEKNISIQSIVLSQLPESKQESVHALIKKYLNGGDGLSLLSDSFSKELLQIYSENQYKNHVVFAHNASQGAYGKISGYNIPKHFSEEERGALFQELTKRPAAFLYQEDRKLLHDISKSNIDPSLPFWKNYSSSIDQRFFYIRDAMHIQESIIDSERSKVMDSLSSQSGRINLSSLLKDKNYIEWMRKKSEITKVYEILNKYFIESGKEIVKDPDDHKITLKYIGSEGTISWHLLSRGEKTIIYMFFMIFLYQEKVRIFLLDEPEISLHVKWQESLIKDLTTLAPKTQFIITTHSPNLVMNGWMNNCLTVNCFSGVQNDSNK